MPLPPATAGALQHESRSPFPEIPRRSPLLDLSFRALWLPLLLLALTVLTTASNGALFLHNFRLGLPMLSGDGDLFPLGWIVRHPASLASGWPFSLTLLAILLAHEAGHWVYCRRHGIRASYPYVLPAPTLSGTAGAVIRIRSRIPTRLALMEVGIAGPIAGYLVALPAVVAGILLSRPAPPGALAHALVRFEPPLTIALLDTVLRTIFPALAPLRMELWHPVLLASWVGLFVTTLNLIPAGQLDGGHILYAISPRWHRIASWAAPPLLLAAGVWLWTGWLLWGLILLVPAMRHPPVSGFPALPRRHRRLGWIALLLLLLTAVPAPFAGMNLFDFFR